MLKVLVTLLAASSPTLAWGRGRGRGRGGQQSKDATTGPPAPHDYDAVDCPKCMSSVMRLLHPVQRGCPTSNGTVVPSSTSRRVPTSYCETLLPKKRACVAYSFGLDGTWDFDKAMVAASCRVLSFDPLCCGGSHRMSPTHDFIPVGLHTYDGLADSDDPTSARLPQKRAFFARAMLQCMHACAHAWSRSPPPRPIHPPTPALYRRARACPVRAEPNTTFPVLSLRTIMTSYEHTKLDVLRLKVGTNHEWKVLKNLINTG